MSGQDGTPDTLGTPRDRNLEKYMHGQFTMSTFGFDRANKNIECGEYGAAIRELQTIRNDLERAEWILIAKRNITVQRAGERPDPPAPDPAAFWDGVELQRRIYNELYPYQKRVMAAKYGTPECNVASAIRGAIYDAYEKVLGTAATRRIMDEVIADAHGWSSYP